MTETFKPGQAGDNTINCELPQRLTIRDLMSEEDVVERVRALSLVAGGTADVFLTDFSGEFGAKTASGNEPAGFPKELLDLLEATRATGDGKLCRDSEGRLLLAFPIWLKCDGRNYFKGCVAASCEAADEKQAETMEALAKFTAGAFTDHISLACGGRVAHREYNALQQELIFGRELVSILENLGAGLMVLDPDLRVVWYNSVFLKRAPRYKPDHKCFEAFGAPTLCDPCPARTTLDTGQPQLGVPERAPDGTIYSRTSTMPILDSEGKVSQVLVLINDVTESDRAEAELISYKRLVNTSDDFMLICDASGHILAVNRKLVDTLGYGDSDVLGKNADAVISAEDAEGFHAAARAATQLGIAMDTVHLRAKDGTVIPTHVMLAYDQERDVYEVIFRDISERLRMEAELRARSEELQAQNRKVISVAQERDRFFRSVSHELRTPLTSIIGFAELLLEDIQEPLSQRQKQLLMRVVSNSHKLLGMVNDLLDFSKIEAGRMEVHLGTVRLDEFIAQVVGNLAPLAIGKSLVLKIKEGGKLPPVHTDEQKLGQIVVNLVSNAIKFTQEGSVEVSAKADGRTFSIIVKDTGIGIPSDETAAIFTEFYQARGPKPVQRGSGLGLAISQRMAALLGGKITVKSKPGVGSSFTVTLPITAKQISEQPAKG